MSACCHHLSVNRSVLIQQAASCVTVILALIFKVMVLAWVSIVVCIDEGHSYGNAVKIS